MPELSARDALAQLRGAGTPRPSAREALATLRAQPPAVAPQAPQEPQRGLNMLDVAPTSAPAPQPSTQPHDYEAAALQAATQTATPLEPERMTRFIPPQSNILPAPEMQAVAEGAAMGLLPGGAGALPTAVQMFTGTKAAELAEPGIETLIPGEGTWSQIGRGVLQQGAFLAPGLAQAGIGAALRRGQRPPAAEAPQPPREPPTPTEPFQAAPPAELAPGWLEAGRPPEPPPIPARQALAGLRQRPPGFEAPIQQPEAPAIAVRGPIEGGPRLSYGEKYIQQQGVEAAQARVRHLNEQFQNAMVVGQSDPQRAANLADEAENIRRALAKGGHDVPLAGESASPVEPPTSPAEPRLPAERPVVSPEAQTVGLPPGTAQAGAQPTVYPGDYVQFQTAGGMEGYGDISKVFDDGTISVVPDGASNPVPLTGGRVISVEKRGSLGERKAQLTPPAPPTGPPQGPAGGVPPPAAEPRARGQRWVGKKEEILREPERFQFKGDTDVTGMGAEMKAAQVYNPQLDQGVTLWRDPADGKLRVINGFNRLGKAYESGYTGNIEGDVIDLPDAASARVFGAVENIAQGRGTPLDAAKIFRDAKLTPEQIEARGVSLEGRNAKLGLGLANLDDALFRKVIIGELSEKQGAMIGRELPDQAAQRALWPALAEGELTDGQLRSLIVQSQLAPVVMGEQEGFAFNTPQNKSLAVPKAKVTDYIDSQLATEKRSFAAVGKEKIADILKTGGNVIETEGNRARALGAAQLREMFGKEIRHPGEINDLLNDAARRIARGEEPNAVFPETYRAVLDQLRGAAGINPEAAASVGRQGPGEAPPAQAGLFGAKPADKATLGDILKSGREESQFRDRTTGEPIAPFGYALDKQGRPIRRYVNPLKSEKGAFVPPGGESALAFVEKVKKSAGNAARLFNPAGRASEESLNAIVGRKGDDIEAVRFQYNQASKGNEAFFDNMIGAEKRRGGTGTDWLPDYLSRVSTGQRQPTPELQAIAEFHRKALDAQRLGEARARGRAGKGTAYIEDYFPGLFKQPDEAERWLASRRPMRGTEGYNEKKFWTDVGLALKPKEQGGGGLEPISPNPEVLVRTRLEDGRKAVWAYDVMMDGRESGRWQWVAGERGQLPEGKAWVDDNIARKYFAPGQFVPRGESSAEGIPMQPVAGRWAVDEGEARLLNNYLSRNLIMEEPTLRGILLANAKLNGVQLGLSGFHMQNESFEAFATMYGQALARAARGEPIKALASLARVPTAPLEFFVRGARAWNDPILFEGPTSPLRNGMRLAQPEGAFAPGSAWDNFKRAARRMEPGRALANLPGGIIDLAQAPIFKILVPRMKAGAYLMQLQDEFERNAAGIADGSVNPRTIARKLAESIDNRMGQVNYDNWFWNNTFKSSMQIMWRAVGWNFGFGRSLVQAGKDIKGNLNSLFRGGPSPGFTPDMQYWAGMIFAQVSAAALYQYLHTGKGLESPTDALYPRNGQIDAHGNEIRVRFANPLKDLYGLTRGLDEGNPFKWLGGVRDTAMNKLGPVPVEFVRTLITNKDYFGDYIRNENDPTAKQFGQVFDYLTQVATPFSIQQRSRISEAPNIESSIEAFAGITKAPAEVITSPLEKEIRSTSQQIHGTRGPRTPEQKSLDQLKVKARESLKTAPPGSSVLDDPAVQAYVVEAEKQQRPATVQSLKALLKSSGKSSIQRQFESLPKAERERIAQEFAQP